MDFLGKVQERLFDFIKEINSDEVNSLCSHLHAGKMLRSKLVQKIAGQSDDAVKLCAVIEMIHAASLLHDDVIDDALTRRGKQSINAIYGNKTAIMLGDILYSKGFGKLVEFDIRISQKIANAVTLLSVGELLDVELAKTFNTNYDAYIDMIYKKTASLIEASSYCAAILANKDAEKYSIFGKNLGLAFQMVDDILDITQDSVTLGKPSMNDFVEGKVTIPYLKMFQKLDASDKVKLQKLFKKTLNEDEHDWIKNKLHITNALAESILEANNISYLGAEAIKDENNEELQQIILQMIQREF